MAAWLHTPEVVASGRYLYGEDDSRNTAEPPPQPDGRVRAAPARGEGRGPLKFSSGGLS